MEGRAGGLDGGVGSHEARSAWTEPGGKELLGGESQEWRRVWERSRRRRWRCDGWEGVELPAECVVRRAKSGTGDYEYSRRVLVQIVEHRQ